MKLLGEQGQIASSFIADSFGISPRQARRILNSLVAENKLEKVGDYRHAHYIKKNDN